MPLQPETVSSLGLALVLSSSTPLILLDGDLVVLAASGSFCSAFTIDPASIVGKELFALGKGEWDVPQLRILLMATASGKAAIDAYEMDLKRDQDSPRALVIHAHVLAQRKGEALRLVLAISDVTGARQAKREKDELVREKHVLLQELNHRVANSLQIIASVLMQRVRSVQSEETRTHLRDAHHRVMSIATLQRQLASTFADEIALRPYFTELCASIGASMVADPALLKLTVDVDDSVASSDRSVSMGLIITELVINSLKHAYPDETARGTITVRFRTAGEGWSLTVADDGVGFPSDRHESESGLGTGIVNALASQLSADVKVTDANPGTLVSVSHC